MFLTRMRDNNEPLGLSSENYSPYHHLAKRSKAILACDLALTSSDDSQLDTHCITPSTVSKDKYLSSTMPASSSASSFVFIGTEESTASVMNNMVSPTASTSMTSSESTSCRFNVVQDYQQQDYQQPWNAGSEDNVIAAKIMKPPTRIVNSEVVRHEDKVYSVLETAAPLYESVPAPEIGI